MNNNNKVSFENTAIAFSSKSTGELKKMYRLFSMMNYNGLVKLGTYFIKIALNLRLPINGLLKKTLFSHFCGGETIDESEKTIQELGKFNVGTILDYAIEGEESEVVFDDTAKEIIRTIEKAKTSNYIPFSVFKVTGIASRELLEKVQAKEPLTDEEQGAYQRIWQRVEKICLKAYELNVRLFIDREETWIQEPIDEMVDTMMEKFNKEKCIVYNTIQFYTTDSLDLLKKTHHKAIERQYYIGIKLVRGAYMEKERERAQQMGYTDPIQPSKKASDESYNKGLLYCIEHIDKISICSGSHNENSNYYLVELMERFNIAKNDERIYFSQLKGMSDHISYNLANAGYNVAKYVPYGPMEAVMPYLFRRAEENTAIAGQSSREFNLVKTELERRKESS